MSDSILIATIAGLGGMLGWGFADFFAKKTIDQIGDIASLVWAHTIASVLLLGYLFTMVISHKDIFPEQLGEWALIIFFGVLQALVYIFVYKGFSKGKLAVLNPIFSSYAGLVAVLSIIVFNETLNSGIVTALVLVFLGILMISLDTAGLRSKRLRIIGHPGLKEILFATILATFWVVFWSQFISGKDWKIYASLMYLFMSLTIILYSSYRKTKLKVQDRTVWKFLIGIGLGEILAYVSISYGFSVTNHTSIVALLSGAFSLPVLVLSYIFLKERVDFIHRLGSIVIIVGIAIISIT